MGKLSTFVATTVLSVGFSATSFAATPDVYVVNFSQNDNAESQALDSRLNSALVGMNNVEQVNIDTSTAAAWEAGAHKAFDRDIVPVFNKWVGLPGFAAVVDARSKRVIGCVNSTFNSSEISSEIRKMAAQATGQAFTSRASTRSKTTQCPPAHNKVPF